MFLLIFLRLRIKDHNWLWRCLLYSTIYNFKYMTKVQTRCNNMSSFAELIALYKSVIYVKESTVLLKKVVI